MTEIAPMTNLSVNINKVALIRNSRGGNLPDVVKFAIDCEEFGAQGITVHPRPDERHIRYSDVYALKEVVGTELNVEGYPGGRFMEMICEVRPDQCTLVPDPPDALTSTSGWDTRTYQDELTEIVSRLHEHDIRVSLFLNPDESLAESAALTGADRIELYTGGYARHFSAGQREQAIAGHVATAKAALQAGLLVNAGHDLNLNNLQYYLQHVPRVAEVSIGHALVCDALYYGLSNVIGMYRRQIELA